MEKKGGEEEEEVAEEGRGKKEGEKGNGRTPNVFFWGRGGRPREEGRTGERKGISSLRSFLKVGAYVTKSASKQVFNTRIEGRCRYENEVIYNQNEALYGSKLGKNALQPDRQGRLGDTAGDPGDPALEYLVRPSRCRRERSFVAIRSRSCR